MPHRVSSDAAVAAVVSLVVFAQSAYGLTEDDLLFYAPMDGTLTARIAKGNAGPQFVQGRVLFVVMNDSDEDAQVQLAPDWKTLGIKTPSVLIDAYAQPARTLAGDEKQTIAPPTAAIQNGVARFKIKSRNFRAWVTR